MRQLIAIKQLLCLYLQISEPKKTECVSEACPKSGTLRRKGGQNLRNTCWQNQLQRFLYLQGINDKRK